MTALQITEIFHSIQGEATHAGWPCIFVRLTGCNLRCRWCDTEYSFHGGQRMTLDEVLEAVGRFPCRRVEITGGEPLLQAPAVAELARELLARGYTVLLETSGERDIAAVPAAVVKILDVKCPGSGEGGTFLLANLARLQPWDALKFVLADRADYEFAQRFLAEHKPAQAVFFAPSFGQLEARALAEWMLADGPAHGIEPRLSLQQHKFIWEPATRGV